MKNKPESSTEPGSIFQAAKYLGCFSFEVLVQLIVCIRFCYNQDITNPLLRSFPEITSVFLKLAIFPSTF